MEEGTMSDSTFNGKNQHHEHDDMQVQETHAPLRRYTSNPNEVVIKVESASWHGGRKLSKMKPGSRRRRSSYDLRRSSLKDRQKRDDLHMEMLATDIGDDDVKEVVAGTAADDDGRCLRCCMIIVIIFMIVAFLGTGGFFLVSSLSRNDQVSTSTSEPTQAPKTTQSPSTTLPPSTTSSLSTTPVITFGSTENDQVSTSTSEPTQAPKTTQSPSTTLPPSTTSSLSTTPVITFGSTENDQVSTSTSEPTQSPKITSSPSTTSPPSITSSLSTTPAITFGSTEGVSYNHECQPGEFWCASPGDLAECVPGEWRCDGDMDCSTAADEIDCGGSATPITSLPCVTWQRTFNQSCDGCDYAPICQPDGVQWTRLQCTLDQLTCWCVEPDSGRTVTGSFTGVDVIEDNEVLNCADFVQ